MPKVATTAPKKAKPKAKPKPKVEPTASKNLKRKDTSTGSNTEPEKKKPKKLLRASRPLVCEAPRTVGDAFARVLRQAGVSSILAGFDFDTSAVAAATQLRSLATPDEQCAATGGQQTLHAAGVAQIKDSAEASGEHQLFTQRFSH